MRTLDHDREDRPPRRARASASTPPTSSTQVLVRDVAAAPAVSRADDDARARSPRSGRIRGRGRARTRVSPSSTTTDRLVGVVTRRDLLDDARRRAAKRARRRRSGARRRVRRSTSLREAADHMVARGRRPAAGRRARRSAHGHRHLTRSDSSPPTRAVSPTPSARRAESAHPEAAPRTVRFEGRGPGPRAWCPRSWRAGDPYEFA